VGWTAGETVGEYRLLSKLGAGGAGTVWRVEHVPTGARRALKVMLDLDPESLERFEREAQTLARLEHPNVARVHTAGEAFGRRYLVLDLAEGGDLEARLKASGPLQPEQAVALLRDLCAGLAHVHAQGVLHRDLKPSNVLFADDGRPLLVDFGLSRSVDATSLTGTGVILGTPSYMAPEQANGDPVDQRTDVYGLGGVLYAALTGQPPFGGSGTVQTLHAVLTQPPTPPQVLNPTVPPDLGAVCLRALAKPPGERYPNARAFAAALEPAPGPGPPRLVAGLAAASAALALAALGGVYLAANRTRPSTPPAQARPAPPQSSAQASEQPPDPEAVSSPLDRRLGALEPVELAELEDLPWPSTGLGTRAELLAGTSVLALRETTTRLAERRGPLRALAFVYQVAVRGRELSDPDQRRASQKAWLHLVDHLLDSETTRRAVWNDEDWQREGPQVLLEACTRAIEAGGVDGFLELGHYYLLESERQFGIPPRPTWALACYEHVLKHEQRNADFRKRASLGLARLALEHPELEGGPGVFAALDRARYWSDSDHYEDRWGDPRALREALAVMANKATESALDDALRALPEVTLEDFPGYDVEPRAFPPPVAELLTLKNPSGLIQAYRWLREYGSPARAVALLYQTAVRGQALEPGDEARLAALRGWVVLGEMLASNEQGVRELFWSDTVWAHVGWPVVHECFRRAAAGGRSDACVMLASLYLGDAAKLGREPHPERALPWLQRVETLEHYDSEDRQQASLYLVEIAWEHPDTPGCMSDEEALRTARSLLDELSQDQLLRARALELEAKLAERLRVD